MSSEQEQQERNFLFEHVDCENLRVWSCFWLSLAVSVAVNWAVLESPNSLSTSCRLDEVGQIRRTLSQAASCSCGFLIFWVLNLPASISWRCCLMYLSSTCRSFTQLRSSFTGNGRLSFPWHSSKSGPTLSFFFRVSSALLSSANPFLI